MNSKAAFKSQMHRTAGYGGYQKPIIDSQGGYSPFLVFLFLLMAAYFVLPLVDVPLMGLSLSAPLFALIAMQVLFRPPEPWFKRFHCWIILAGLIYLGIFFSTTLNGLLSSGVKIDRDGWLSLIRYAYWLLTFVITAHFTSRGNMLEKVSGVLGWAIFILALARLFELAAWGKIGAWSETQLMTQNSYGFLFSVFFPFLLAPIITTQGPNRWFMLLRMVVAGAAVLINGSRGSWISVATGIVVFSILYVLARPQKIGWSLLIVTLSALVFLGVQFAPTQIATAFGERFATFQALNEDKSYAIRLLMDQKGLRLFERSPLIGVGASRFTKESIPLDIPQLLNYAQQSHFDVKSAHNSYVAFLAETGLAGSLPYAILILTLVITGLISSFKLVKEQRVCALSVYASFIGMSIHMWGISSLTNTANWFIYGLVAAVIMIARQPKPEAL